MKLLNEAKSKFRYEVRVYYEYDRYHVLYETKVSSLKAVVRFLYSKAESLRKKSKYSGLVGYTAAIRMLEDSEQYDYFVFGHVLISLESLYERDEELMESKLMDPEETAKIIEDMLNRDHEEKLRSGFYNESRKKVSLQKRFEHVLHNNKSKDIISGLITNADAIDKNLARVLGVKTDSFTIDPHSRKSGLVVKDIKGSDNDVVVFVDGDAEDGIVVSGALKRDVKVVRKLPSDSSVKRIAGMIATVIYEMDTKEFDGFPM